MTSSARRVTRSQASHSFFSLGSSPRKQKFTLDVGNEASPQKILVTVESGEQEAALRNVSRRLFQSPAPRVGAHQQGKTTTTIVPLKGLTDDEGDGNTAMSTTPKKKVRMPKSATPVAGKRGRPPTPRQGTPRQPRRPKATQSDVPTSDISIGEANQSTARPRFKTPKRAPKRKSNTPAKGDSDAPALPKKRGRPRKNPLPDATPVFSEADRPEDVPTGTSNARLARVDESIFVAGGSTPTPSNYGDDDNYSSNNNEPGAEEEDIWMAGLSDQSAPAAWSQSPDYGPVESDNFEEPEPLRSQSETPRPAINQVPASEMSVDWAAAGDANEIVSTIEERRDSGSKDTVVLGEEFTMISLGSLQSLHANSSIHPSRDHQQEVGDETSLIINRTLESLRRSRARIDEGAENSLLEDPALAGETESTPRTSGVQGSGFANSISGLGKDDSRNSMVSQPSPAPWSKSPRKTNPQPLGRQLAMKSVQREDAFGRLHPPPSAGNSSTAEGFEGTGTYEDSFSEIPDDVLEAATPRVPQQASAEQSANMPEQSTHSLAERSASPRSNPTEQSKLLTPDETPSPNEFVEEKEAVDQEEAADSPQRSEMHSSPPIPTLTRRESSESIIHHPRRGSSETPVVHEPSSPYLPPRVEGLEAQGKALMPPESIQRPTLSPIVRAGRALQLVTSDPPSPPERGSALGSPFKSSTGKPSQSPTPVFSATIQNRSPAAVEPQPTIQSSSEQVNRSWTNPFAPLNQFKNMVIQGARALSPRRESQPAMDDPFSLNTSQSHRPNTVLSSQGSNSNLHQRHSRESRIDPSVSMTSSTGADLPTEDGMSFQANVSPIRILMRGESPSSTIRGRRGSIDDIEMSLVDDSGQPVERVEEVDVQDDMQEDEEDDIWAVEAQRPTPGRPQTRRADNRAFDPPRQGVRPTPWGLNNRQRSITNSRTSGSFRQHSADYIQNDDVEDFSMLSQQRNRDPPPAPPTADGNGSPSVPKSRKVDLSTFFSSPASVPGAQAPGMKPLPFGDVPDKERNKASPQPPQAYRQQRMLPIASPKKAPQISYQDPRPLASTPRKVFQVGGPRRVDIFSPVKQAPSNNEGRPEGNDQHSSSPTTPERPLFTHVPQKRNFTPRSRQPGNVLFNSGSGMNHFNQASNAAAEVLSESDDEGFDSDEDSSLESSFIPPELKPLPDRSMSPTKSCIRSPLKPKTPGRVVEFASTALSPLQQAEDRARNRASKSPEKQQQSVQITPVSAFAAGNVYTDKENQLDAEESYGESAELHTHFSPDHSGAGLSVPKTRANPPPASRYLSQSQWTRDHWTRLDELLQERRQSGALQFQLRHGPPPSSPQKDHGGGSVSSGLLGKLIAAQGETMTLDQWHLDVIDAFKAEVGGWEEPVLAKRLFALMVGEQRRRRGEVPFRGGIR